MKTRLGCLTLPGISAVILGILIFGGITIFRGDLLYNPGALNALKGVTLLGGVSSHNELKTDCSACHPAPWQNETMTDRCLACHPNVKQDKADFHQKIFVDRANCRDCHTEHRGTGASLTIMDLQRFPHRKIGFSLNTHQETENGSVFACSDCHGDQISKFEPVLCGSCHTRLDSTYMLDHVAAFGQDCLACHDGVDIYSEFDHSKVAFQLTGKHRETVCSGCHSSAKNPADLQSTPRDCSACHGKNDPHLGRMGGDCASCHNADSWQESSFDHATVVFPLLGKHTAVACVDCHLDERVKITPQDCFSCHGPQEPHEDQLGQDCASCHNPAGWTEIEFDHSTAKFQLLGRHFTVACQDCHKDQLYKNTPQDCYTCHGIQDPHQGQLGQDCAACHTPVDWKVVIFDHSKTVFPLLGKHTSVECKNCHQDNLFKNTPQDCYSCHSKDDEHGGELGKECASCHTPEDWDSVTYDHSQSRFPLVGKHIGVGCRDCHVDLKFKSTPANCFGCHAEDDNHKGQLGTVCESCHTALGWDQSTFDHSISSFPLTGQHLGVSCASCHPGGQYKGIPKNCFGCHANDDQHNGQYGTDCAACHTTAGWAKVSFDHSSTSFPLNGKHVGVNCTSCHVNGQFKGTPKNCYGCHANDDNHNGQLGQDCAACHSTAGWDKATFDHSQSSFPLTGKHMGVNCASCHVNGQFKGTPKNCYACHANDDNHNGQLGQDCAACHTTSGWDNVTFDHSQSEFPLAGKHVGVNCASCHPGGRYRGTPKDCYSCHAQDDAHNGQMGNNCGTCHTTSGWEGASFDHSGTSFPLVGKHSGVSCNSCHVGGQYGGTPKDCYSCHAADDEHGGQYGTDCALCHDPNGWEPAHYDHSGFPLTGAHAGVPCTQCHPGGRFQGTPTACSACHDEPAYHAGLFSDACNQCHTTSAWRPAEYDQPHTFPMSHGGSSSPCRTCHPARLSDYTCYSCHDPTEIRNKHLEEGIPDFDNCMQCHPDGQEHDRLVVMGTQYEALFNWLEELWGDLW
jgi:hypothetical protein